MSMARFDDTPPGVPDGTPTLFDAHDLDTCGWDALADLCEQADMGWLPGHVRDRSREELDFDLPAGRYPDAATALVAYLRDAMRTYADWSRPGGTADMMELDVAAGLGTVDIRFR